MEAFDPKNLKDKTARFSYEIRLSFKRLASINDGKMSLRTRLKIMGDDSGIRGIGP